MGERARCYICGKLGHKSRQCPQKAALSSVGGPLAGPSDDVMDFDRPECQGALSIEDVPVALVGVRGVVRFTILEDPPGHQTPPLIAGEPAHALGGRMIVFQHWSEPRIFIRLRAVI